ncbi:hypothetical protein CLU79DRAFT_729238 [Phycomyces nitens]|nr:hypothetical protein CLU79DRAFT_729238 [Phycomyces nitens]
MQTLIHKHLFFDIFELVATHLSVSDRRVCLSVCHQWHSIFMPALYCNITTTGHQQFKSLLDTMSACHYSTTGLDSVGYFVRSLSIQGTSINPQELRQLTIVCPLLRIIQIDSLTIPETHPVDAVDLASHLGSWKYLRQITERFDTTLSNTVLSTTTNNSLTHLSVCFPDYIKVHLIRTFFTVLPNAQYLRSLSINRMALRFDLLEWIHTSCPQLETLCLLDITLQAPTQTIPQIVSRYTPSTTMRTFKLQGCWNLYEHYEWIYYIAQKYPNVQFLELNESYCEGWESNNMASRLNDPPETIQARYNAMVYLAQQCRQIIHLHLHHVALDGLFFEVLERTETHLKSLSLGDMTWRTKNMVKSLASTRQPSLRTLTLWDWCYSLEHLTGLYYQQITSLTLSARCTGYDILGIDAVLVQCQALQQLTLEHGPLGLTSFCAPTNHPLTTLVLRQVSFKDEIFGYLSMVCRHLSHLSLISCRWSEAFSSPLQLDLATHTLISLDISQPQVVWGKGDYESVLHYKVVSGAIGNDGQANQTKVFKVDDKGTSSRGVRDEANRTTKIVKLEEECLEQLPFMNVYCKSIHTLRLYDLECKLFR